MRYKNLKTNIIHGALCAAILMVFSFNPTMASDKAATLSLEMLIQQAFENSPETARILSDVANAQAEAFEVETLNNPELETNFTVANNDGSDVLEIEIEQPLRLSNFGSRSAYATAIRNTANAEQKAKMLELVHSITRAYADYWGLQETEHVLEANAAYANKKRDQIRKASKEGRLDVSEAQIFKAEAMRLEQQLLTVRAQKRQTGAELLRMAGSEQRSFSTTRPKSPVIPSLSELQNMADTQGNIRQILQARKELADRRYAVARDDAAFPEFAPRATFERDFDEDSSAFLLGFRINIPVWNRNNAEVIRASAEQKLTTQSLKALDEHNFANVLAANFETAKAAQNAASSYQNSILPEWQKVQDLTDKKFAGGQASVLDLWQIRGRITDMKAEALQARLEAIDAQISLETLIGQTLSNTLEETE